MDKRVRGIKPFAVILLIFALMFTTAIRASADMGPKPSIKLTVKNAPDELYIIDLLQDYEYKEYWDYGLGEPRETMLRRLFEYESDDGMKARINVPVDGNSFRFAEGDGVFSYGYMTPDVFRVIIITESGQIYVSEKIKVRAYNSEVTYDAAEGTLREDKMRIAVPHIVRFTVTFLFTLFIEWVVLLCFKYRLRDGKNGQVFLLTNLCTQMTLYILLNFLGGFMVLIEILIAAVEAFIYSRLLTPKEPKRADSYALTANAASAILGIPIWMIVYFIIR